MVKARTGLVMIAAMALAACGWPSEQTFTGPDGEEMQVERSGDGTVTYRTEDGEATVTTGGNDRGAVGGLPGYPGARSNGGFSMNATGEDGGIGQISSFQTSDALDEVIAFYRNALESRGYRVTATMTTGQHQAITAEGNGESGVHITATSMGGQGTTVSVIAGQGVIET